MLQSFLEHLPPVWSPASKPTVDVLYSVLVGGEGSRPGVRRFNLLYADHFRLCRSLNMEDLYRYFAADVQLRVAEEAPNRSFVHAGVVGWRGRAIVIPGDSFCGKTTLVKELVRNGATYYSDEYAVLDRRGRVHPYALPLSVREGSSEHPAKYTAEELGGVAGSRPLPVGLVVVSRYEEGAQWRPRRLSQGRGLLALLASTVSARRQPQAALATMTEVVRQAAIVKGVRGEVEHAAMSILKSLG